MGEMRIDRVPNARRKSWRGCDESCQSRRSVWGAASLWEGPDRDAIATGEYVRVPTSWPLLDRAAGMRNRTER